MGLVETETRVTQRAFSLVEVLVALAVLILLGALVLPTLHGLSDTAEFRETCDQLSSAVSVCRSEAQRRGTPMELVARKESDGRVSLVGRPARLDESSKEKPHSGQVLLVLPQGYSINHESAAPEQPDLSVGTSENDAPAGIAASTQEDAVPKPLVVFWASGATAKGSGLYLHTRDGRVMGAEINSFTGALRLEQLADGSDGKAEAKSEGKTSKTGKTSGPMVVEPGGP